MAVAAVIVRGRVTVPHVKHGFLIRPLPAAPAPPVAGIVDLAALECLTIFTDCELSGDAATYQGVNSGHLSEAVRASPAYFIILAYLTALRDVVSWVSVLPQAKPLSERWETGEIS